MQNNNPLTEIAMAVCAVLLILAASFLLFVGKIDTQVATNLFILATGIVGVNGALKAPSPSQQQQIVGLVNSLQSLVAGFMLHSHPVATPLPVQQTAPAQPVQSPVQPVQQQQFKAPVIPATSGVPDISMPLYAVPSPPQPQ